MRIRWHSYYLRREFFVRNERNNLDQDSKQMMEDGRFNNFLNRTSESKWSMIVKI